MPNRKVVKQEKQLKEKKRLMNVVPFRKQHKAKVEKFSRHRSALKTYKSYNFVDKDPIIYACEHAVKASGMSYKEIEAASGVSTKTLSNWFYGKTRRPQFATLNAVARAIGFNIEIVKQKGT